ncbi:hypothetical protein D3C80_1617900 [compost metagenome]
MLVAQPWNIEPGLFITRGLDRCFPEKTIGGGVVVTHATVKARRRSVHPTRPPQPVVSIPGVSVGVPCQRPNILGDILGAHPGNPHSYLLHRSGFMTH